ncbi:hypothetical protein [Nocardia africana]
MNNSTKMLVTAAIAATALAVASVSAHADPPAPSRIRAALAGDSVVVTLGDAEFDSTRGPRVAIVDERGNTVAMMPTAFEVNHQSFSIRNSISEDARTLTLTPDLDAVKAADLEPIASPMEEQLALSQFATDLGTDMSNGSAVGTLVGATVGLALGLGSCLVTGPSCLAITPAAVAAFAGGGAIVGTLLGGATALAGSGWTYIITVQSPPGQSPYAGRDAELNAGGTGVPDSTPRLPTGSGDGLKTGSSSGGKQP